MKSDPNGLRTATQTTSVRPSARTGTRATRNSTPKMRKDTRLPDGLKQLREMSLDIARSSCRNREQREYYRVINQIESELNSRGECGFVYYKVTYQRNIGAEGECRSKFDVVFSDRPFENRLGYCELKRKPPSAPLDTAYYRTCGEIYGVAYKSNCCGN